MLVRVRKPGRLEGDILVPGDKSISHRALMFNAIAEGKAVVRGLSPGADVLSTASCLRQLGVSIEDGVIQGRGMRGLEEPSEPLDCGNSGTTMRLLAGLLSGCPFRTTLLGDESLSRRPMDRVANPLRALGAWVETSPLRVGESGKLVGKELRLPVASAQVKSAVLLAGLQAEGETTVVEVGPTRNHTELMLAAMGAPVRIADRHVTIGKTARLNPLNLTVLRDFSSAAFWLVLGAFHAHSLLRLPGVGLNSTRSGLLEVLEAAGVRFGREAARMEGLEPVADLTAGAQGWPLTALAVGPEEAALSIDELPILAVAAAHLPGISRIVGARELRFKETDRISAMALALRQIGVRIEELDDGWQIEGCAATEGSRIDSQGDHRVAMAMAVAGMLAEGVTEIEGAECVDISYPGFWDQIDRLGGLC
ncbi:MAG TPA: 3-phosphoshikimate 1-carboxyvinyltransferase [Candidatus Dormibacteraeota bacterium]|jgi:3-phosphoshikimate 1-carboxyvinyltransferase|nr:3-phosphoshikimate 1-carboxyvinyltransferase [Candidatus Dormibacteraeota bacterium]